jgi:hypothetical protein
LPDDRHRDENPARAAIAAFAAQSESHRMLWCALKTAHLLPRSRAIPPIALPNGAGDLIDNSKGDRFVAALPPPGP